MLKLILGNNLEENDNSIISMNGSNIDLNKTIFLNDPILAKDHFENFYNNVGYPISLSRGAYWLGRSYDKINKNLAEKWYEKATKFLTTYYGQLAHLRLYPNQTFELPDQSKVDKTFRKNFSRFIFISNCRWKHCWYSLVIRPCG